MGIVSYATKGLCEGGELAVEDVAGAGGATLLDDLDGRLDFGKDVLAVPESEQIDAVSCAVLVFDPIARLHDSKPLFTTKCFHRLEVLHSVELDHKIILRQVEIALERLYVFHVWKALLLLEDVGRSFEPRTDLLLVLRLATRCAAVALEMVDRSLREMILTLVAKYCDESI